MSAPNKLRALKTCVQSRNATVFIFLLLTLISTCVDCMPTISPGYAVVVDAGSSGTRCWVYKLTPVGGDKLPKVEAQGSKKSNGGLAKLYEDGKKIDEVKNKIIELVNFAEEKVPAEQHSKTPIYFMATAGMRSLSEKDATVVFKSINELLNDKKQCPFKVEISARILAGQEEGLFSWITVNYRQGNLDGASATGKTTGVLECGGASLQIAFVPQSQILDSAYYFKFHTNTFLIYAHSFMDYGQDAVIRFLENEAVIAANGADPVIDHCKVKNFNEKKKDSDTKIWKGTGDFGNCSYVVKKLFKINDRFCSPQPCSFNNVYQPSIPSDLDFVSIGAFFNTFMDIRFEANKAIIVSAVKEKATAYCSQDYAVLENEYKLDDPANKNLKAFKIDACSMAVYFSVLLSFFSFQDNNEKITPIKQIQGVDIDWTVGALIYETEHGGGKGGAKPEEPCPSEASSIILKNFEFFLLVVVSSLLLPFQFNIYK